ncbi:MAG TPA: hypothetical protein VIY29_06205 [Ktedonobacteraceae bacterium]
MVLLSLPATTSAAASMVSPSLCMFWRDMPRARSHKKPATRPFLFKKARALFLIGKPLAQSYGVVDNGTN